VTDEGTGRAVVFVRGRVQGVGFRWWTRARALELGLDGYARNMPDGRVEVCAQGDRAQIERLVGLLDEQPSRDRRPGRVDGVTVQWHQPREGLSGFTET
jgi:acylphosphatase